MVHSFAVNSKFQDQSKSEKRDTKRVGLARALEASVLLAFAGVSVDTRRKGATEWKGEP